MGWLSNKSMFYIYLNYKTCFNRARDQEPCNFTFFVFLFFDCNPKGYLVLWKLSPGLYKTILLLWPSSSLKLPVCRLLKHQNIYRLLWTMSCLAGQYGKITKLQCNYIHVWFWLFFFFLNFIRTQESHVGIKALFHSRTRWSLILVAFSKKKKKNMFAHVE